MLQSLIVGLVYMWVSMGTFTRKYYAANMHAHFVMRNAISHGIGMFCGNFMHGKKYFQQRIQLVIYEIRPH